MDKTELLLIYRKHENSVMDLLCNKKAIETKEKMAGGCKWYVKNWEKKSWFGIENAVLLKTKDTEKSKKKVKNIFEKKKNIKICSGWKANKDGSNTAQI